MKNKIPLNSDVSNKQYFKFVVSKDWKNSIELSFDTSENISLINLFIIFNYYLLNGDIPCTKVGVGWRSVGGKFIIVENIRILRFRKMILDEFIDWYEWRLEEGKFKSSQQEREDEVIYFLFTFEYSIIKLKKIDITEHLPIYPWNQESLKVIREHSGELDYLREKNKRLEEELNDLKKLLKIK